MLKNFIIFFIVSIVAILLAGFFIKVDFTSAYGVGLIIGYWLITGGLAIFITYLPAGIFWLIKRKRMPGTYGLLCRIPGTPYLSLDGMDCTGI